MMNNQTLAWALFWLCMFVIIFAVAMLVRNRVAKTEPRRYSKADDVDTSISPTPLDTEIDGSSRPNPNKPL